MKKILLTVFIILFGVIVSWQSFAFVRYEEKHPQKITELEMTGYIDYAPFGFVDYPDEVVYGSFHTVFQPMIDQFIKDANLKMHYNLQQRTFDDLTQKVRQGDIDFLVGAYYQTELFKGLDLLYPAVIYNPITVFMLPNRINEVKSTADLQKLKGVRNSNEFFSDFVEKKAAELNPIVVDSSYKMFEKLFTREADYIITSYYYGMFETIKLGIQQQIAASKQSLWNIPMFVGVSKTSRHRELISRYLTRYLQDKNNLETIKRNLQTMIKDFETKYYGVVPPTFGLEKQADENLDNKLDDK